MDTLDEKFKTIAKTLKNELLFPDVAMDIPDEYIILALIPKYYQGTPPIIKAVTGQTDYEHLEFLGDAVLEMVTTEYIYNNYFERSVEEQHLLRVSATQNLNLSRVIGATCSLRLADVASQDIKKREKQCADILEAIIGAVYLYLKTVPEIDPIEIIRDWLVVQLQIFPRNATKLILEKKFTAGRNPYKKKTPAKYYKQAPAVPTRSDVLYMNESTLKGLYSTFGFGVPVVRAEQEAPYSKFVATVECPRSLTIRCSGKEYIGASTDQNAEQAKIKAVLMAINTLGGWGYS